MTVERVRKILEKDYNIDDQEHYEITKIINNDKDCFLIFLEFIKDLFEKELQYKNIEIIEGKSLPVGTFLHKKSYRLRGFSNFFKCINKIKDKVEQKTWLSSGHEVYITGEPPIFEAFYLWFFTKSSFRIRESFKNDCIIFIPLGSVEQIITEKSKTIENIGKILCMENPEPLVIPMGDFTPEPKRTHPIYKDPITADLKSLFCKKGYRNEIIYELISELENELDIE